MWRQQSAAGEELDVEVIPRQEHWDEGFALGNSHFPSVFLQFHKSLHLEKMPHGNERKNGPME